MGLFNDILKGAKSIFGDDPSQYVEEVGAGEEMVSAAAIAIKRGDMTKEEAAEALQTRRNADKSANELDKTIEAGIELLPSERLDSNAHINDNIDDNIDEPIPVKTAEKVGKTGKDERDERS